MAETWRRGPCLRVRARGEQPEPPPGVHRLHHRQGIPAPHGQGVRGGAAKVSSHTQARASLSLQQNSYV